MCSDVRYNTWLHSVLFGWVLGGGCLSPAGVCRVTFLQCSAVVRYIHSPAISPVPNFMQSAAGDREAEAFKGWLFLHY
jgi:hypothetical protein